MADYYPLISRAVSGLSDQSPEMRGAVFDRARSALLEQLRSLDPPLSEEDIEIEREGLDRAIAAIEAEYSGAYDEPDGGQEPAVQPEPEPDFEVPPATAVTQDWSTTPSWPDEPARDDWPEPQIPDNALSPDFPEPEYSPPSAAETLQPQPQPQQERAEGDKDAPASHSFTLPGSRAPGDAPARREVSERVSDRARPRVGSVAPRTSSGGGFRAAVVALALVLLIGSIASVAYWLSNAETVELDPAPAVEAPAVSDDGKIAERIGGEPAPVDTPATTAPVAEQQSVAPAATPAPGSAPAVDDFGVAQRAILYEEDSTNPQAEPRAAAGRAVWHLDPPVAGAIDPTVRAIVEFADAALTMTMTISRNLDPTLPASHTIELSFVPGGQAGRNVRDIGLLQLKDEETVRGAPVAGLPVPVQDNFFLIGLSNIPGDIQRNTNLLTGRNWIDLPIRFAAGQRAIVSFEKGMSGDQVIAQAFQAWNGEATAR